MKIPSSVAPMLLVVLVFVAVFAGYWLVESARSSSTAPPPLFTYQQAGHYTYVAHLANNTLYNTTTLTQGNGTLFTSITQWVNVTYAYELTVGRPANASSVMSITEIVQTSAWSKSLGGTGTSNVLRNGSFETLTASVDLNISNITTLVSAIEKQTGYSPSYYSLVLTPTVTSSIAVGLNATGVTFAAPLTFNFSSQQITPSRLSITQRGEFTPPGTPDAGSGGGPGLAQYTLLFASLAAVAFMGVYLYITPRPRRAVDIEALTRPYQEAIVDTATPPPSANRVDVPTWTDLVKVADTLGCPILRVADPSGKGTSGNSQFYVISGSQAFVFEGASRPPPATRAASLTKGTRGPAPVRPPGAIPRPRNSPTPPIARAWSLESFVQSAGLVDRAIRDLPSATERAEESRRQLLRAIEMARRGQLDAAWVTLEAVRSRVGPWDRSSAQIGGSHLGGFPPRSP
jgi:hypothetical protein